MSACWLLLIVPVAFGAGFWLGARLLLLGVRKTIEEIEEATKGKT